MDRLEKFTQDLILRGLTPHTIETYRSQVKSFLRAYPEPAQIGLDDLRAFLGELRSKGLSGSTLRGYFASISSFFDYLMFDGAVRFNPVLPFRKRYLRIKVTGETRQLISIQDMQLLVNAAKNILDKALIMVLAKTGMRRGELLSLRVEDINLRSGTIRIPAKAKRTNKLAFIDWELREILGQYLTWRVKKAKTSWLWISDRGGRIHKDVPNRILADLGAALGLHEKQGPLIKKLTCHCMRHWFTTWLYRKGMDPEHIKWLRGDSLTSEAWQIYNHIDIEEVRIEYLRRIPGLLSFDQKISRWIE